MSGSEVVHSRSPTKGAARWRELCDEYDRLVGTQAEFCRLHGITGSSLRYWQLKQETAFVEATAPETTSGAVELPFGDGTAQSSIATAFAEHDVSRPYVWNMATRRCFDDKPENSLVFPLSCAIQLGACRRWLGGSSETIPCLAAGMSSLSALGRFA